MKPVNGCAVHYSWKLSCPYSEGRPHRRKAQNYLEQQERNTPSCVWVKKTFSLPHLKTYKSCVSRLILSSKHKKIFHYNGKEENPLSIMMGRRKGGRDLFDTVWLLRVVILPSPVRYKYLETNMPPRQPTFSILPLLSWSVEEQSTETQRWTSGLICTWWLITGNLEEGVFSGITT